MNVVPKTRPRSNTDSAIQSPQQTENRKRASSQNSSKAPLSQSADEYSPSTTFEMGKYKTKLCRHWKTGYCLFGPSCVFAHGVDDLCEPNLLVQQMSGMVLVPLNMNGYAPVQMPFADNNVNGPNSNHMQIQQSNSLNSVNNGGLLSMPIFPYMPSPMAFTQGGNFQMVNQMPLYSPHKRDFSDHHDHVCVLCSESLNGPKPKAFLPCMHEFHEECIQTPEKNILELGCPSCPSSSVSHMISKVTNTPTLSNRQPTEVSAE